MTNDPHCAARGVHIEWDDQQAGRVKGIGIVPKFASTPGGIFRSSVGVGHDNQRVYGDGLGLTQDELAQLARERVI